MGNACAHVSTSWILAVLLAACGRVGFVPAMDAGPSDADVGADARADAVGDAGADAVGDAMSDAGDGAAPDAAPDSGGRPTTAELSTLCGVTIDVPVMQTSFETTVYVDAMDGEDDPTVCTDPATPCKTIPFAVNNYVSGADGDLVEIRGGMTYPLPAGFRMVQRHSGSAGRYTVLRAQPGTGTPVLDGMGTAENTLDTCCGTNAASWVWFEGLGITGAISSGLSVNGEGADFVVVHDCDAFANGAGTSRFPNSDAGFIINNGPEGVAFIGNRSIDNVSGGGETAYGIYVGGVDALILRNHVEGNDDDGIVLFGSRATAIDNTASGNQQRGIDIALNDGHVVCANRAYGNVWEGIRISQADSATVRHNTVTDNLRSGLIIMNMSPGAQIVGNIFAFNELFGLERATNGIEPNDTYNLYFSNSSGSRSMTVSDDPTTDIEGADPEFVNRAAGDFTLMPGSPAIGAGPDGFDIGAPP